MSDGMSDGAALGRLETALFCAAYDFVEALQAAQNGHRGWIIAVDVSEINSMLRRAGFELRRIAPADGVSSATTLPPLSTRLTAERQKHDDVAPANHDCKTHDNCALVKAALDRVLEPEVGQ